MSNQRTIVLDTSAFIAGINPSAMDIKYYSVPEVRQELTKENLNMLRFQAAKEAGKLLVLEPNSLYKDKVNNSAKESGDIRYLSNADMSVLALTLQLDSEGRNPTIVTDDYSVQNVAEKLNLEFTSVVTFGIRFYLNWLTYCPACFKKYPSDYKYEKCEICGTKIQRKPLNKIARKRQKRTHQAT